MPRYFFDVHDDGPAEWDDIGHDCRMPDEIKSHAVSLIAQARARQKATRRFGTTTTVIVQREEGGIVLTAIARADREVQFIWPSEWSGISS